MCRLYRSVSYMFQFIAVCVCVCVGVFVWGGVCFHIIFYVNCFGRTVLYVCIEYCILVHVYDVSSQGTDECMINVHYHYLKCFR